MTNDELPEGWAEAPFSAVTVDPVQRVPASTDEITYIDIGSVDRDTKTITQPQTMLGKDAPSRARKVIKTGDVLVSTVRPNLNAVALVDRRYDGQFASTGFDVLRSPVLDPRWVFFSVRTPAFVERMTELVQGALYPAVRSKDVRAFAIPIAPFAEQKRIADKLEAVLGRVAACRARLDRVPDLLKRFRQSVLAAATSGRLTEDWREENNAAIDAETALCAVEGKRSGKLRVQKSEGSFEDISLFHLPRGWSWVKNHRLAVDASNAICAGPFGTIFKAKDFRDEGVPIIFLRHVGEGQYLTKKPGFMDPKVWRRQHQEYSVQGGELLVTKLGDPPGTACIYPNGIGVAMVTPDVMKMEVDSLVADTKFLMFFFNSPLCKDLVKELAFGATRLRIDLTMFKNFPIPLPPREEQQEIVRRVEALFAFADRIETRLNEARAQVERLTPATLAKAFRGELVPQDPNDEPATKLLTRVQTEAPQNGARRRPQSKQQ